MESRLPKVKKNPSYNFRRTAQIDLEDSPGHISRGHSPKNKILKQLTKMKTLLPGQQEEVPNFDFDENNLN